MTQVSISEGARLADVSRSTLNRHIKEGKISRHRNGSGKPYVETSELIRFYGELSQPDRTESDSIGQRRTTMDGQLLSDVERELIKVQAAFDAEKVRREVEQERRELAEAETAKWQKQAERLTMLLTDQREHSDQQKRGLWARLFG